MEMAKFLVWDNKLICAEPWSKSLYNNVSFHNGTIHDLNLEWNQEKKEKKR